ncbi:MAG: AMP-binding protein [bacterium]|nr:AMP-binding protein [bacterium]
MPATDQRAYVHRGGATPLWFKTLDEHLRDVVARFPEREAVVAIPQERRITYAGLDREVERLSAGLLALGVTLGARVGVWSTDNLEWVLLQCATARIGAVLVNVNPACKAAGLEQALRRARVEVLFFEPAFRSSRYAEMVCEVCPAATRDGPEAFRAPELIDLRALVLFDPAQPERVERLAPGFHTWAEVIERGAAIGADAVAARAREVDPDDPVNVQFTSGTTGVPKAVVLTHHNLLNNAWFAGDAMRFTEHDRLCVPVPFYHCFGMVVSNLVCLSHGAAIVIPAPHFEAGATLQAIQDERCTAVHGVPTMFTAELERKDFGDYDLSSLRTGIMAGAPCPPELVRRVLDEMGCRELLIGYGQTETSPLTHLTDPHDTFERRTTTVGRNLPHQEVKLTDVETGRTTRRGEIGEVCFRGYHVMRGYFEQEDATRRAIDAAGWLHSGDLGVMEADGSLRITGRLKDLVIRGGENVYPAEIEAVLGEHPAVAESAVFGVEDERMGEEIGAWVRLREGTRTEPVELRELVLERLAHFKAPRYIWLVDEFPLTVTGKIQKFAIHDTVAGWERERLAAADLAPRV